MWLFSLQRECVLVTHNPPTFFNPWRGFLEKMKTNAFFHQKFLCNFVLCVFFCLTRWYLLGKMLLKTHNLLLNGQIRIYSAGLLKRIDKYLFLTNLSLVFWLLKIYSIGWLRLVHWAIYCITRNVRMHEIFRISRGGYPTGKGETLADLNGHNFLNDGPIWTI